MMVASCPSDGSVTWLSGRCGIDFTVAFEDYVLILIPATCLLLIAPIRLRTIWSRSIKVATPTVLQLSKNLSALLFIGSSFAMLVANCTRSEIARSAEIPASVVAFLASGIACALSYLEHLKSIRPSKLLQLYLLVALVVEAVHLRTTWTRHDDLVLQSIGILQVVSCASFLAAESAGKEHILLTRKRRSPQDVNDLFSERMFWWLNHLFKQGYRKILLPTDLDETDKDLSSPEVGRKFRLEWLRQYNRNPEVSLIWITFSALTYDVLFPVLPRLLLLGVTFAQPYLILRFINYLETTTEGGTEEGVLLVLATAVVYTAIATFQGWYKQSVGRLSVKIRGCLITALHDKALRCRSSAKSSPLMLMNVDVEKAVLGVKQMHDYWATILAIGIALALLYMQIGYVFIAPLILLVALITASSLNGKRVLPRQKIWLSATQDRVSYITGVIASLKNIKLLGIGPSVLQEGTDFREREVEAHKAVRLSMLLNITLSNCTYQLATLVLYTAFAVRTHYGGPPLTNTTLFTSLSILKLFTTPMMDMIQAISTTLQAISSSQRIQSYLIVDGHPDHRRIGAMDEDDSAIPTQPSFRLSETHRVAHLQNVTCQYSPDAPALANVSCTFKPGTLTMILGSVGSGKSTLLRTLLGEMNVTNGFVSVATEDAAFCEQTPWLWHGTVKENICGASPFDGKWFDQVIWACALQEDLQQFPKGIHTLVGSDGTALSGGQKNRISLARALYSRKRLMLLDDILSGLDTRTEQRVWKRVLGPTGLLKTLGCTVLFATHAIGWIQFADYVICIADGKIEYQGSPRTAPSAYNLTKTDTNRPPSPSEQDHYTIDSTSYEEADTQNPTLPEATQGSDMRVYRTYLRSFGTTLTLIYFLLSSAFTGTSVMQNLWLKWWASASPIDPQGLAKYAGVFGGITAGFVMVASAFIGFSMLALLPRSSKYLHVQQWTALVKVSFASWGSKDTGSVANRFSQDISIVDSQLSMNFINFTAIVFDCIATAALLIIATPFIAAALPVLLVIFWAIQKVYLRTSKQLRILDLEAKAPMCTHFLETVSGIVTITAYRWSQVYHDRNAKLLEDSQVPFYLLESVQNWLSFVLNLVVAGLATTVMAIAVRLRSNVDAGYVGLALIQIMDLGMYCEQLIVSWTGLETSLGAITRMNEFIDETPQEEQGQVSPPLDWLSKGEIRIENLVASYSETAEPILKNINLSVKAGEKVALCGRTGSGKSSLASSIFGLLYIREGSVSIDDVDITKVSQDLLRSQMVAIPQDPYFSPGTVRHNLALTAPAVHSLSDSAMLDALRKVGLFTKFNALAAESGDTWLGALDVELEPTNMLTKGQMQLFAMARAIISDGQIVLVDEATSGLDHASEIMVQKLLREELSGRTIIAIAHHLQTIMDFDTVIVVDNGRIAEMGSPTDLAHEEGTLFSQLLRAAEE
ncbi:hypothetical protein AAFC00_005715 [Neodothiora populina]|uniref:P-loop containing nucleoside triphosphate hydrolase protein n=1 Tax=Neodothiora populina TaxID=2781224 RepID=A0ABR3P5M2_9PEZI